ncbi:MAG: hypothetical protein MJ231_07995 [bacterium]|nr:hypothetical protein [bacterium]
MDDYMVVYKNLPHKVHAFTMYNAEDNYYTIVLNSRISYDAIKKAFEHELHHIMHNDFCVDKNVADIELNAHSI